MTDHLENEPLETIEIDVANPVGSVIWLHGLGADGHDFEPIVPELAPYVRSLDALRFVFPNAPVRPVTINGGAEMRAWYDIDPSAPLSGTEDIHASAAAIEQLVQREQERGIPRQRIVLAGFSQGGVIALHLGLRASERFAGILALSTYLHDHEHLDQEFSLASVDIPIFMAHGQMDPMIPITRAITSREKLRELSYQVEWHEYGMGHQVCPEEIADIGRFLDGLLPSG